MHIQIIIKLGYGYQQLISILHLFFLQEIGINAELGLTASEDAILDTLSDKAEKEIIGGGSLERNLIGHCAPFLSKLCRNFSLMQKVILNENYKFGLYVELEFLLLLYEIMINNASLIVYSYHSQRYEFTLLLLQNLRSDATYVVTVYICYFSLL